MPPTPASWDVYKIAKKAIWLGAIEAPDKQAAVEKAAQEFKTEVWRLYAMARRWSIARAKSPRPTCGVDGRTTSCYRPTSCGLMNSEIVRTAAVALSAASQTYPVRRGDLEFVVFCFTKPVNADVFSERSGGKRLTYSLGPQRRWPRHVSVPSNGRALTLLASIPHGIAESCSSLSTEVSQWSNNGAAAVTPSVE
jgi:hypothetical protein